MSLSVKLLIHLHSVSPTRQLHFSYHVVCNKSFSCYLVYTIVAIILPLFLSFIVFL